MPSKMVALLTQPLRYCNDSMQRVKRINHSFYTMSKCLRSPLYFVFFLQCFFPTTIHRDISNTKSEQIILISEIANLLATVIRSFPATLDTNEWDLIRIAVSSWVLTLSKSSENFHSVKVIKRDCFFSQKSIY